MTLPVSLIVGVIAGAALTMGLMVSVLRSQMVVARTSAKSFEDTCAAIERVVPAAQGWGFPIPTWNAFENFANKDLVPKDFMKLQVYFVCNASLGSRMLSQSPSLIGMMPCRWAVYEMADGSVMLSKMNVGLMSRMFSGVVGATMSEVSRADDKFLAEVLSP